MTTRAILAPVAAAVAALLAAGPAWAAEPAAVLTKSGKKLPAPPWAAGDELGMANQLGPGTWLRCAWHLGHPKAKAYELSYLRSNTMPKSPFISSIPMFLSPLPQSIIMMSPCFVVT